MHRPIKENLEEYLGGMLSTGETRQVEDHLDSCPSCRRGVNNMREHSDWLRELRASDEFDPAPGFYARVMDQIETQKVPSIWSALLEPVFAKRLAYSSLVLLLLLGSMVVSVGQAPMELEQDVADVQRIVEDPQPPQFGIDQERDRNVVLVNLATYPTYQY